MKYQHKPMPRNPVSADMLIGLGYKDVPIAQWPLDYALAHLKGEKLDAYLDEAREEVFDKARQMFGQAWLDEELRRADVAVRHLTKHCAKRGDFDAMVKNFTIDPSTPVIVLDSLPEFLREAANSENPHRGNGT